MTAVVCMYNSPQVWRAIAEAFWEDGDAWMLGPIPTCYLWWPGVAEA